MKNLIIGQLEQFQSEIEEVVKYQKRSPKNKWPDEYLIIRLRVSFVFNGKDCTWTFPYGPAISHRTTASCRPAETAHKSSGTSIDALTGEIQAYLIKTQSTTGGKMLVNTSIGLIPKEGDSCDYQLSVFANETILRKPDKLAGRSPVADHQTLDALINKVKNPGKYSIDPTILRILELCKEGKGIVTLPLKKPEDLGIFNADSRKESVLLAAKVRSAFNRLANEFSFDNIGKGNYGVFLQSS